MPVLSRCMLMTKHSQSCSCNQQFVHCVTLVVKYTWLATNMTWHGNRSALWHLPALYNKRNYCIHVHGYLLSDYTCTFLLVKPVCIFKTGHFGIMSIKLPENFKTLKIQWSYSRKTCIPGPSISWFNRESVL